MFELWQSDLFRVWRESLKDKHVRGLVSSRLDRLARGHVGDAKVIGDGVSELRIHYGPGFRIYFQRRNNIIVVLLCGGDKGTQTTDIRVARQIAKRWNNNEKDDGTIHPL